MRRSVRLALIAYVGLAASAWLPQSALLAHNSDLWLEIGAVLAVAVIGVSGGLGGGSRNRLYAVGSGILLFSWPALLSVLGEVHVPELTRVAMLSLVPSVVVVFSAVGGADGPNFLGWLGASLAGAAGVLLLLSVDPGLLLQRPLAGFLLVLLVLGVGWGSYLGHAALEGMPLRSAVLWMVGPSVGVMLGVAWWGRTAPVAPGWGDLVALVWRSVSVWLLLWLIREVRPVPLASRYLLVPLVTAVEGYVLLRPALSWRMLVGAALLLGGSTMLLRARGEEDSPVSLF